jgi:hypothetical protein
MALGSTQHLTEMSPRNLPGSKGWRARKADYLTAPSVSRMSRKCGSLDVSEPYGPPWLVTRIVLPFFTFANITSQSFVLRSPEDGSNMFF